MNEDLVRRQLRGALRLGEDLDIPQQARGGGTRTWLHNPELLIEGCALAAFLLLLDLLTRL